jgi:hypothetical protein
MRIAIACAMLVIVAATSSAFAQSPPVNCIVDLQRTTTVLTVPADKSLGKRVEHVISTEGVELAMDVAQSVLARAIVKDTAKVAPRGKWSRLMKAAAFIARNDRVGPDSASTTTAADVGGAIAKMIARRIREQSERDKAATCAAPPPASLSLGD